MDNTTDYTAIGTQIPILDDGWVMLVDKMGSDEACVKRARLSHNGEFRGWDVEGGLLAFLMRHEHKSVFQAARMVVRIKLPLETLHEVDRHRTVDIHGDIYGSDVADPTVITTVDPRRKFPNKNEASGRYIDLTKLGVRRVPASRVGRKGTTNKQGTEGAVDPQMVAEFLAESNAIKDAATEHIQKWTAKDGPNLAYEVVRGVMPLDNYTIVELDTDALWWMDFFRQRLAPGAKAEVRELANAIFVFFKALFPRIAELFEEYTLNSRKFAGTEMDALRGLLRTLYEDAKSYGNGSGDAIASFEAHVEFFGRNHGLSGGTLKEFVTKLTSENAV